MVSAKQTPTLENDGTEPRPKILIENLTVRYSDGTESLRQINLASPENAITVLFGPAGGGKSTLLRTINRLNDLADVVELSGHLYLDGRDVLAKDRDVIALRRNIGMVFARPVVLPMSIRQNLTYALELAGVRDSERLNQAVEESLKAAALWQEVEDRLDEPAVRLSGGQQQRLCIARALVLKPEVILLDEPSGASGRLRRVHVGRTTGRIRRRQAAVYQPQGSKDRRLRGRTIRLKYRKRFPTRTEFNND
jgi:phosphate transport system ATP-binding protein